MIRNAALWGLEARPDPTKMLGRFTNSAAAPALVVCRRLNRSGSIGPQANNQNNGLCLGDGFYVPEGL